MTLPARTIHVPCGLPIDESVRSEWLDFGKANRSNVNVRIDERGALTMRPGYRALTNNRLIGARSSGRKLFEHNGVPAIIDGTQLDSFVEGANCSVTRSRVTECTYRLVDCPTPTSNGLIFDTETCNGYTAVISNTTGDVSTGFVVASVIDSTTGAVVRSFDTFNIYIGLGYVTSYGDQYFVAFVHEVSSSTITAWSLDTLNLAAGWSLIGTVTTTAANIATTACSLPDRVAVAFATSSGTNRLTVRTYSVAGVIDTLTINTSSITPDAVGLHSQGLYALWIAWNEAAVVKARAHGLSSLATVIGTTGTCFTSTSSVAQNGVFICEGASSNTAWVYAQDISATVQSKSCHLSVAAGAVTAASAYTLYNAVAASRPFNHGDRYYMAFYPGSLTATIAGENTQGLFIVCDVTDNDDAQPRPIANVEPGLVIFPGAVGKWSLRAGTNKWAHCIQTIKSGLLSMQELIEGNSSSAFSCVELDFGSIDRWPSVSHGNTTVIGGALVSIFDGERVTELGFLCRPHKPSTSLGGTGITGSYRYVATFEDIDAAGNIVVSGISDPTDSVGPANQTVTVSVPPLTITSKIPGRSRIVFYRTTNGGQPPYYRLGAVYNTPFSSSISFADNVLDTVLLTRELLYAPNLPSSPGESLDRRAPPGLVHLESYNGMLAGAKGESVFFSGQEVYGEATWFSPVFEVPITGGGEITGLKALDGVLYVFKRDRIYAITGEAPSDNGLTGGLGTPRLISSDVGCTQPSSLVATSLGIFFRSDRGIEILNRGQNVEWIGEQVQRTVSDYPYTTAAVRDELGYVRFTMAESLLDGAVDGEGVTLVYDLTLRGWVSKDVIRLDSQAAQSASRIRYGNEWCYAWLSSDGTVYVEDDSLNADALEYIEPSFEPGICKLGLQQEQRVFEFEMLIEHASNPDGRSNGGIRIEVAEDYGSYGADTADKIWDEAILTDGVRQIGWRTKEHGSSVGLRVRGTEPLSSYGRGFAFIGISVDLAPKQGPTRGTSRIAASLRR